LGRLLPQFDARLSKWRQRKGEGHPTEECPAKVRESNLEKFGCVPEHCNASGQMPCNLPCLVATHYDSDVTHHDSRGHEADEKPEVTVIYPEHLCDKFADRVRVGEKWRRASRSLANLALVILFLCFRMCSAVDSALGQFGLQGSLSLGRQLFRILGQLQEFFVGFCLLRSGEFL
jgi:hypothetical protein